MSSRKFPSKMKILREETMLGLNKIILKMYKSQIDYYFDEEMDKFKMFEIFKINFHNMFSFIEDDFEFNLKILEFELMEKFKKEFISEIHNIFNHKKIKDNKSEFNPVEYEIKN